MKHANLIIIGNGMACQRLLSELVSLSALPDSVLVFSAEARPAYNRVLLSSLLSGEMPDEAATLCSPQWYQQHGITLVCNDTVQLIDKTRQLVISRQGLRCHYDKLVIATGALPVTPAYALNAANKLKPGICYFRNWQDLDTLRQASQNQKKQRQAVVVGGGFLGLEAAEGLRKRGMQVTVLQRGSYLLNRQLDDTASLLLASELQQRGLNIRLNCTISTITANNGRLQLQCQHSCNDSPHHDTAATTGLTTDLLVLAAGITPNVVLAQRAGLNVNRGIVVNAAMQTSDNDIYALGECCEFEQQTYGLLAPINEQARTLATVLSGKPASYCNNMAASALKISGIHISSCGDIAALQHNRQLWQHTAFYHDKQLGEYRRLWWRDNQLVGAVLYGDTRLGPFYTRLIQTRQQVTGNRAALLFDPLPQAA